MAYSVDLRERVIAHLSKGYTYEETSDTFSVGKSTITRWVSLLSETGCLEKRPLNRSARIFESEKLITYIEENSNALLKDVADYFGGSITGAFYALEREKITLKKRALL
jgi:transposase